MIDYPDSQDLEFSDEDARDVYNRFRLAGFSPGKVKVLTESAATYEAIEDGFNWLDAQENENMLVVVHYSGHGGQIKDDTGDEVDDRDEVIVPQDTYDDFAPAIRDDQLDEWLSRLESEHIVVILDSCDTAGMAD
jgi:hypothetical protein